jgi:predicted RNA binding protein YcfA (HicA-like mRNA interferase family)
MPSEVPFRELRKYLESHGWTLDRISGSHHIFRKAGERPIVIPVHGHKVKHVYDREVRKRLGPDRQSDTPPNA